MRLLQNNKLLNTYGSVISFFVWRLEVTQKKYKRTTKNMKSNNIKYSNMSSKSKNKNIYEQKLSSFLSSYFVMCISINAIAIEVWFPLSHISVFFPFEAFCPPFLNKTLRNSAFKMGHLSSVRANKFRNKVISSNSIKLNSKKFQQICANLFKNSFCKTILLHSF